MKIRKIISGIFFFTLVIIVLSFTPYWDSILLEKEVPKLVDMLVHAGFVSAMVLWLWMLGSFFKSGTNRFRILIGFSIRLFNLVASPVYCAFLCSSKELITRRSSTFRVIINYALHRTARCAAS